MSDAVRPDQLRQAIAEAIAVNVKSYDVADVCVGLLGLDPPKNQYDDPNSSKRAYVKSRLTGRNLAELAELARKVVDEYGDADLSQIVARLGASGVSGEMRNLIFAANGPKPKIVLRDAINNVIEIEENAQYCLVYDRPLGEQGLSWRELAGWWGVLNKLDGTEREIALNLYRRLAESLAGNDCEKLLFTTYCELYAQDDGFSLPALIPQVYLHYDPYARQPRSKPGSLVRQRMDFLLLLPHRNRVVIEVDGRQHYADDNGTANTTLYAEMVREDRSLRLAGYEVYRFGGKELMDPQKGRDLLGEFFRSLLERHDLSVK